jgi:hypothetical protein
VALQLMEYSACGSNQTQQFFEVINQGTTPVTLSDLTFKFWADDTTGQGLAGAVNYGGCFGQNCASVSGVAINTANFLPACGPDSNHQANWEITVSNSSGAVLGAGMTWTGIQTAIHLANWAIFSPGGGSWYSPCAVGGGSVYTNDLHYALYCRGNLVTYSGGQPPACRPIPTCGPSGQVHAALDPFDPTPTQAQTTNPSVIAAPNLSRGGQPIEFRIQLPQASSLNLTLYSLLGEKVYQNTWAGKTGSNSLLWPLKNTSGSSVVSGLYIYVLEVDGTAGKIWKTGKVVILH